MVLFASLATGRRVLPSSPSPLTFSIFLLTSHPPPVRNLPFSNVEQSWCHFPLVKEIPPPPPHQTLFLLNLSVLPSFFFAKKLFPFRLKTPSLPGRFPLCPASPKVWTRFLPDPRPGDVLWSPSGPFTPLSFSVPT